MLSEHKLGMQSESQERRTMRRFDMRLPAVVRLSQDQDNEFHTETTFPPHITLTDAVRVRFTARVIRVESPLPSSRVGTAAMIENYEFLRSNGTTDFFSALEREAKN
jgi:hypothetical protein